MPRVYSLAALNVSLAGIALEGFDASEAFTVNECVAPFGDCRCDECTRRHAQYGLGMFDEGETVRTDITDAVIDALALYHNPPTLVDVYDDWNALGVSDPVTLPPLELRF